MIRTKTRAVEQDGDYLDVRPQVAARRKGTPPWVFAAAALFAALVLFLILNNARLGRIEGEPSRTPTGAPERVPDLVVPQDLQGQVEPGAAQSTTWARPSDVPRSLQGLSGTPSVPRQARVPTGQLSPSEPFQSVERPQLPPSSAIAYPEPPPPLDRPAADLPATTRDPSAAIDGLRVIRAARSIDPSTTILQGSTIHAVLESALDSTAPGQVRALVTRDARSVDGTSILIPRGSRLYGTYEAGLGQGQRRLQVRWSRLVRPDMVSINLDSPASDPLGRAGVPGRVNSHFLQRLGNALLSSTFSVGGLLASRSNVPVVVAVPGAALPQAAQQGSRGSEDIKPTLRVRQGTRVSVFVQHDLDFSDVEPGK